MSSSLKESFPTGISKDGCKIVIYVIKILFNYILFIINIKYFETIF